MINLIEVIDKLKSKIIDIENHKKEKIKEIEDHYNNVINKYKDALQINIEMNEVCLECEGKGRVKYYNGHAYDRGSTEICSKCNGTGKKLNKTNL